MTENNYFMNVITASPAVSEYQECLVKLIHEPFINYSLYSSHNECCTILYACLLIKLVYLYIGGTFDGDITLQFFFNHLTKVFYSLHVTYETKYMISLYNKSSLFLGQ